MAFAKSNSIRIKKGLWLVEQAGRTTYAARGYHEGKLHYTSCETGDYRKAEQRALKWFGHWQRETAAKRWQRQRECISTPSASQ